MPRTAKTAFIILLFWLPAGDIPAQPGEEPVLGIPAYPHSSGTQFAGSMETNQVPLDAAVLTTEDDIQDVMAYYRTEFERLNVNTVEHWFGPDAGYIGFLDKKTQTMRLVNINALPSGGSMLVYSSMDPRPLLETSAEVPKDLPSHSAAKDVVTTKSVEGRERQRTVGYSVSDMTADDLGKFITKEADRLGWKKAPGDLQISNTTLVFLRGRDRCIIQVEPMDEGLGATVLMVVNDQAPEDSDKPGAKP
jgi:hypothetical protein